MQLMNLSGASIGLIGLFALSGVAFAQPYPEWGAGHSGRGGYPYPYGPSYGYGLPTYAPAYPTYRRDALEHPPVSPYSREAQAGSDAEQAEPTLPHGMAGVSEEERAARARFEARRRAMEERRQALRAAIEKLHIESSISTQQTKVDGDYSLSSADKRGLSPQDESGSERTAEPGIDPESGIDRAPVAEGSVPGGVPDFLEGKRPMGATAPMGMGAPHRASPMERRAALEARRQAIQQRRDQVKAAFEERRRIARAAASDAPPVRGPMPPSAIVEPPSSGDADTGEVEKGVENQRPAGEPASMGLGLPEPDAARVSPEG